jgi:hypothetical protein
MAEAFPLAVFLCAMETTMVGTGEPLDAMRTAMATFDANPSTRLVIPVQDCRQAGIQPWPF